MHDITVRSTSFNLKKKTHINLHIFALVCYIRYVLHAWAEKNPGLPVKKERYPIELGEVIYNGCCLSRKDRCQSAKSNTLRLKIKSHLHTFTVVFSRLEMSCQFVKQKELAKTSINPSCWLQVVFVGLFKGWVLGKYKHLQTALAIVQVLGLRPEWCRIAKGRCRVFQGTEWLDEREMDRFHPSWERWYTRFFLKWVSLKPWALVYTTMREKYLFVLEAPV